jgi:hypothetical protein
MRPAKPSKAISPAKAPWQPPAVTRLAVGTQTRSAPESEPSAGRSAPGSGRPAVAHPEPPAAPATKFGLSLEMAFPLSARIND